MGPLVGTLSLLCRLKGLLQAPHDFCRAFAIYRDTEFTTWYAVLPLDWLATFALPSASNSTSPLSTILTALSTRPLHSGNVALALSAISATASRQAVRAGRLSNVLKKGQTMDMGQRIKRLRDRKGLSLRQLSELCGVERGLLSRIERGQRPHVSVPVAMRIAKALGVTLDYLAGMYEEDEDAELTELAAVR